MERRGGAERRRRGSMFRASRPTGRDLQRHRLIPCGTPRRSWLERCADRGVVLSRLVTGNKTLAYGGQRQSVSPSRSGDRSRNREGWGRSGAFTRRVASCWGRALTVRWNGPEPNDRQGAQLASCPHVSKADLMGSEILKRDRHDLVTKLPATTERHHLARFPRWRSGADTGDRRQRSRVWNPQRPFCFFF